MSSRFVRPAGLDKWIDNGPLEDCTVCLPWDGHWFSPEAAKECIVPLLAEKRLSKSSRGRLLQVAVRCGNDQWVNILLNLGAKVDAVARWDAGEQGIFLVQAIHVACSVGNLNALRYAVFPITWVGRNILGELNGL